tara:strand:+ start:2028 stop:2144 length:117 start_codon:yes stop_codon:yes gene_type:complete
MKMNDLEFINAMEIIFEISDKNKTIFIPTLSGIPLCLN